MTNDFAKISVRMGEAPQEKRKTTEKILKHKKFYRIGYSYKVIPSEPISTKKRNK